MHTTPLTLLERLREPSDGAAWQRFVQLYAPLLFYWAKRAGADDHEARDLVQDVFVVLVQTLPTFEYNPAGKFRNWLQTIVINKLRDRRRREARLQRVPLTENQEPELPDHAIAFWEAEYRRELTQRALELLQSEFEPTTWQACWQFIALGRPAHEVARSLGISENAVYLAKCRVVRRLRAELSGLLD